jgi:GNAT superfamily N-acetyltransferase
MVRGFLRFGAMVPLMTRIRAIRAGEWEQVRELRLASLQDPVAHLAFIDTYEQAVARPDSFYQERAAGAAEGTTERQQFVAESDDGSWAGSVTVLVERAGTRDFFEKPVERDQGHAVGVYVRPEHRGTGLAEDLFAAALEWAWAGGLDRVRLHVHERNGRAAGLYRKLGFQPSGQVVEGDAGRELEYVLTKPGSVNGS